MNVTKETPVHQYLVRWPDDGSKPNLHLFATSPQDCAEVVCERIVGVHFAYAEVRPITIPALGVGVQAWMLEIRTKDRHVRIELALRIREAQWIL